MLQVLTWKRLVRFIHPAVKWLLKVLNVKQMIPDLRDMNESVQTNLLPVQRDPDPPRSEEPQQLTRLRRVLTFMLEFYWGGKGFCTLLITLLTPIPQGHGGHEKLLNLHLLLCSFPHIAGKIYTKYTLKKRIRHKTAPLLFSVISIKLPLKLKSDS